MGEKGADQAMLLRMLLLSRGSLEPALWRHCRCVPVVLRVWLLHESSHVVPVVDGASRVTKPTCGRFPSVAAWEGASERLLPCTERM